jgi:hypothetical protein
MAKRTDRALKDKTTHPSGAQRFDPPVSGASLIGVFRRAKERFIDLWLTVDDDLIVREIRWFPASGRLPAAWVCVHEAVLKTADAAQALLARELKRVYRSQSRSQFLDRMTQHVPGLRVTDEHYLHELEIA